MIQPLAAAETLDPSLCEREPIHIPGAIQPHGALLAALPDGSRVTHASANLLSVLGVSAETALGQPLAMALGAASCRALLGEGRPGEINLGQVQSFPGPGGSSLHMQAHRAGGLICVDIEPVQTETWQRPLATVAQSVLDTFKEAASRAQLCELAVRGLQAITSYDRVMAYRFDKDGHGEVIAEACSPGLVPFLGVHYPASDIPSQARRQYLNQPVGMVGDSNYQPVPLLEAEPGGEPLDLTHSTLRSVSPVHREYMRNMKTGASLTIGLSHRPASDGLGLWGLLVCHHTAPRVAGPELRATAGMIGQVVSLLLGSMGTAEITVQRLDRNATLHALVDRIAALVPVIDCFTALQSELLHLVDATGAVVRYYGKLLLLGRAPDRAAAERALDLLYRLAGGDLFAVDDLGLRYPDLADCIRDGSGALLTPLGDRPGDAILWFRPEQLRTITWGGNPEAHATMDPVSRQVFPRRSFEAWKAVVQARAVPWAEADLVLAADLRRAVDQATVRRRALYLFEYLVETSPIALVVAGEAGQIKMLNRRAEVMFGYKREELLDQPLERLMPQRFRAQHVGLRQGFLAGRSSRIMGAGRRLFGLRKDGSEFPIEVGLDPIDPDDRQFDPMVQASITDLTLVMSMEREQQRIEMEKDQKRDLQRSNADLEEFSYAVSHDLKAPLRAIGHLSQWICDDIGPDASPATLENLRLLTGRVTRMQKLLDGLLQYCRIGRPQTSVEAVNVQELVREIEVMLGPPAGFVVVCESDVQPIRTERVIIQLVLENLIGNALKHHDQATGRVVVGVRMVDGLAEFRVTDDGPGIPPQYHARIFQMFQTLQSRDTLEASGLGLAIVKRHVETHSGKIWVESDPSRRGSCFAFTWKPAPGQGGAT